MNIKDLVINPVEFVEYRKGNLWYKTTGRHEITFPVPIEDTGDGIFRAQEKGLLLMRYIRKHLDNYSLAASPEV